MSLNKIFPGLCICMTIGVLIGAAAPSFGQAAGGAEVGTGGLTDAPAQASDTPSAQQADAGRYAELEAEIKALVARVEQLEQDKAKAVEAPFTVKNAQGQTIFSVESEGSEALVRIVGPQGKINLRTNGAGGRAIIASNDGNKAAIVSVEGDGPQLYLQEPDRRFVVATEQGKLRLLLKDGGETFTAGSEGGSMTAGISGAGETSAKLVFEGAEAALRLKGSQGKVNVRTLPSGGRITLAPNDGNKAAIFSVEGDGPQLTLQEPERRFIVGTENGKLKLLLKDGEKKFVVGDDGQGVMKASVAEGQTAVELAVKADQPFVAVDTADRAIRLGKADGVFGLQVQSEGSQTSLGESGDSNFALRMYDAKSETLRLSTTKGSGSIALLKDGAPTLTLGPTAEKDGPGLRAYYQGKMVLAAGSTTSGLGAIVTYGNDGQIAAGMESSDGGNGSIYVQSKGQVAASINSADNPGQGLVVVRAPSGTAVAYMTISSQGGGSVTAADPSGSGVFAAGYIGADGPGAACVEHKGTKCLGIGLTGMEGFH